MKKSVLLGLLALGVAGGLYYYSTQEEEIIMPISGGGSLLKSRSADPIQTETPISQPTFNYDLSGIFPDAPSEFLATESKKSVSSSDDYANYGKSKNYVTGGVSTSAGTSGEGSRIYTGSDGKVKISNIPSTSPLLTAKTKKTKLTGGVSRSDGTSSTGGVGTGSSSLFK